MKRNSYSLISKMVCIAVVLFLVSINPRSLFAAGDVVATWIGGTGNWSEPSNWDIGSVPNNGNDYDNDGLGDTFDVVISTGNPILDLDVEIEKMSLSGGSITGDYNITTYDTVSWTGGSIGVTSFTSNGDMNMSTLNRNKVLTHGCTLTNQGVMNFNGYYLRLDANSSLINETGATFNIYDNGTSITYNAESDAYIENRGTLNVDNTVDVFIPFNNIGQVNISDGNHLKLHRGGLQSGVYGGEGTLNFGGGSGYTYTMESGYDFEPDVTWEIDSGVDGAIDITVDCTVSWSGGSIGVTSFTSNGVMNIITLNRNKILTNGCMLTNQGVMNFSGYYLRLDANSSLINEIGAIFNIYDNGTSITYNSESDVYIENRGTLNVDNTVDVFIPFNNSGQVNISEGNHLKLHRGGLQSGVYGEAGSVWFDGGSGYTYTLESGYSLGSNLLVKLSGTLGGDVEFVLNGTMIQNGGVFRVKSFTNNGTLNIDTQYYNYFFCPVSNNGIINYARGQLQLRDGITFTNEVNGVFNVTGDISDIIDVGSGSTFENKGTMNLSDVVPINVKFNNYGTVNIGEHSISLNKDGIHSGNFTGMGTLNFGGGIHTLESGYSLDSNLLVKLSGTLGGDVDFVLNGTMIQNGGVFRVKSFTNNGTLNIDTQYYNYFFCPVSNNGIINYARGQLHLRDGITFTNEVNGVFNVTGDISDIIDVGSGSTFENKGTMNLSDTLPVKVAFENYGTVNIYDNLLSLDHNSILGGSFTGTGILSLAGYAITYTLTSGDVISDSIELKISTALTGDVDLVRDGVTELNGGAIRVNSFTNNGILNIVGQYYNVFSCPVVNYGTINYSRGQIWLRDGITFTNKSDGIFNVTGDIAEINDAGTSSTFVNEGTMTLGDSLPMNAPFINSGIVNIGGYNFHFGISFTQYNGVLEVNGGSISGSTTLNIQGGSLIGSGTISAPIISNAVISPGFSIGSFIINQNVTLEENSDIIIEAVQDGAQAQFDTIDINASLVANGKLILSLPINAPDFITNTDVFEIINTDSTIIGSFLNAVSGARVYTPDMQASFSIYFGPESPFGSNSIIITNFNDENGLLPPDLKIQSPNISFDPLNPDPNEVFSITAQVSNNGQREASDVIVRFYDFDTTLLGETVIPLINPDETIEVSVDTSFSEDSYRLITVKVDPDDDISELKENNNQVNQVLQVGEPDFSTAIIILQSSSRSTYRNQVLSISGRADYDFDTIPGDHDFPVQGGLVTVQILENDTVLTTFTGSTTDVNGNFSQPIISPENDGVYTMVVSITDFTLIQEEEYLLTVDGVQPDPDNDTSSGSGPGPAPSGQVLDIVVNSSGILFSDINPQLGDEITVFAYVYYLGDSSETEVVSVRINDLFPVAGNLESFHIGSGFVSFDGTESSPQVVTIPWNNTAEGSHVIQVSTEASFVQPTSNDKATKSIFVGINPDTLQVQKTYEMLIDLDNNGLVSSGDVLTYNIEYEYTGSEILTGVVLTDLFDNDTISMIENISDGGLLSGNKIVWDIDTIDPGTTASVEYEATVAYLGINTTITNIAVLDTEQTPPVSSILEIDASGNTAPIADAGADQMISQIGTEVQLDGSQSYDQEGDELVYSWTIESKPIDSLAELDDAFLITPSFIADKQGTYIATLVVTDIFGLESQPDSIVITFTNSAPIADAGDNQSVEAGDTISLDGSNSYDPNLDPLSYNWVITSKPAGSDAELDDSSSEQPTFMADLPGTYLVSLVVNDGFIDSNPDSMEITVSGTVDIVEKANQLLSVVNGLSSSNFKHRIYKRILVWQINSLINLLERERYLFAYIQLRFFIFPRTDGCHNGDTPDRNDWIVTCNAQNEVLPIILEIINLIEELAG